MEYIFDIGLNSGQDTDFYLSLGYNVIGVDANPNIISYLKLKYEQEILDNRLILLDIGIYNTIGTFEFYLNRNTVYSSFNIAYGLRSNFNGEFDRVINVNTTTLSEIINQYGIPYYMKIDVEGSDLLALESLTISNKSKYISVKLSDINIITKLMNLGYTKFKYIDQSLNINHGFVWGSSGYFGENTIGNWLNYNDALILNNNYADNLFDSWIDIHATF
jgi:FkbM family methyltransferase